MSFAIWSNKRERSLGMRKTCSLTLRVPESTSNNPLFALPSPAGIQRKSVGCNQDAQLLKVNRLSRQQDSMMHDMIWACFRFTMEADSLKEMTGRKTLMT